MVGMIIVLYLLKPTLLFLLIHAGSDSVAIELFENNFEDLMETQLGLPEGVL